MYVGKQFALLTLNVHLLFFVIVFLFIQNISRKDKICI